jgi:hypothetical protein
VLEELSPHLRGTLAQHCYGPAISTVPFFHINMARVPPEEKLEAEMEHNLFVQQVRNHPPCQSRPTLLAGGCAFFQVSAAGQAHETVRFRAKRLIPCASLSPPNGSSCSCRSR